MKWAIGRLSDYSEAEYEKAYENLSETRRRRIDRLKKDADRKRSLLGEILVKKLLIEEGIKAEILSEDNGKPYLSDSSFFVSISHSGEMAAAVISEKPVGIDIEKTRQIDLRILDRVCTEREADYVKCDKDSEIRFFEVWTAKEAYFKKQGTGITNFKSVEIFDLKREFITADGYFLQIVY